jgi:hypothetical protein
MLGMPVSVWSAKVIQTVRIHRASATSFCVPDIRNAKQQRTLFLP